MARETELRKGGSFEMKFYPTSVDCSIRSLVRGLVRLLLITLEERPKHIAEIRGVEGCRESDIIPTEGSADVIIRRKTRVNTTHDTITSPLHRY